MNLIGQRWEYRVGNSIVLVDNAFVWIGWAQERLVINEETVASAGGWLGMYRSFSKDWLTRLGEGELRVALSAQINGIACELTVDGEPVVAEGFWEARWSGNRGTWPEEASWQEAGKRSWISHREPTT